MKKACPNRVLLVSIAFVLGAFPLASVRAQTAGEDAPPAAAPAAAPAVDEALTNDQVVALVTAGLSEGTIVLKIRGSKTRFDTSADALVRLKEAGVSDALLAAMLSPAAAPQEAPPAAQEPAYEPGVYLVEADELVQIEPTVFTRAKTGSSFWTGMTYGISKAKVKAQIPGRTADVRTGQNRPAFEFHFQGIAGLMFPVAGASTPAEFLLVPLASKNDRRELTVGEVGLYTASAGVKNDAIVQLEVEKLGPGRSKVAPKGSLKPGEYCFYYQSPGTAVAAGTGGKVFAFGIGAQAPSRAARK